MVHPVLLKRLVVTLWRQSPLEVRGQLEIRVWTALIDSERSQRGVEWGAIDDVV